ncbi:endoplasmic reticulum-resident calcium binding protein (ERC) [Babesia microti strain RI]|uniref:Endoplasmic reticulum-resident calcium binding protein (ERC) n=1 Tax=Babesia microti (strain RI) TaxID=1133968 RepID=A0A1N6LXP0_BABMR|nr:endoplasmic reticulum-resident calcium binding protein (ERC) [Babesia microti strain RI]SIO73631.1 endoplasmic reticulum-resident calcium binding protein (ERC) [Babesia microti strain RI]|eukprot:XP_021337710.1 endoplasmic reticulum-resident calcium binding protein (ERC) [Babesia microti strain RI]
MKLSIRLVYLFITLQLLVYVKAKNIAESLDISQEELTKRCDKLFELIDKNKDGILDHNEVVDHYDKINLILTEKQIHSELVQIDINGDGVVSFDELHNTLVNSSPEINGSKYVDSLKKRFKAADKDESGTLDSAELSLLINPGKDEVLMEIDVQEVFENHDIDKDGKITLEEFKETSGQDFASSESEFSFFDTDGNGYLDENEIRQIYDNEAADSIENLEEFFSIFGEKSITKKLWDENMDDVAISPITDFGEVIRHPQDYRLDIGENKNENDVDTEIKAEL